MKSIIRSVILIALSSAFLQGCSLFKREPVTSLTDAAIYNTETSLESALVGCYRLFYGSSMYQSSFLEFFGPTSGMVHWKDQRVQEEWTSCFRLSRYSNDSYAGGAYVSLYQAINACNILIGELPSSPVDDSFKLEIEAEAKLLRAIHYYTLVRLFGDTPILLEKSTDVQNLSKPRTKYDRIYAQILQDLTFAEENMRDASRQLRITGTSGRPNKMAATAFKASVYMTIGSLLSSPDDNFWDNNIPARRPDFSDCGILTEADAWRLCLGSAKKVMDSGVYTLCPDYYQLFRWTEPEDFKLGERIFVLQSGKGIINLSKYIYTADHTLPMNAPGTSHAMGSNTSYGRVRPTRWVYQKWAKTYAPKYDIGRADGMDYDVAVGCEDPRFDATYIHYGYTDATPEAKEVKLYPQNGYVVTASISTAFPFFRKYLDPTYNADSGLADFYMLRYGEIFLIAAEACASLSQSIDDAYWKQALEYVDVIMERARNSGRLEDGTRYVAEHPCLEDWKANGSLKTKDNLIKAIMWERVFEMHGEFHEMYDVRRRGAKYLADEVGKPLNEFLQQPSEAAVYPHTYMSAVYPQTPEETRKSLLFAFPEYELRTNKVLSYEDQNPYCWK